MKKIILSSIALLAFVVVFTSCGGSKADEPEGFKVPTILNGPLGDYYDIVSVNVRPFNEEETKDIDAKKLEERNYYKIIVEVKKNTKSFDFDASKVNYTSYMTKNDTDAFCVAGQINSEEGEELDAFSFKGKDGVETLLISCSKEGATKKFSGEFHIKKGEVKGNESIELVSVLKTTADELEQLKEGIKMMKEMKGAIEDENEETDE